MSSPTYQQNKVFATNWKKKNIERQREYVRLSKRRHDAWKKIQKTFLSILLI
jgi:hypothetical protein